MVLELPIQVCASWDPSEILQNPRDTGPGTGWQALAELTIRDHMARVLAALLML